MNYKVVFLALMSSFVMSFASITKVDFRPPGTVEVVDNFFYDVREICNNDWREYLSYLKVNEGVDSEQYKNATPDTMVWYVDNGAMDPFVQQYYAHPSYGNYPVVGISHKQATDYCKWRTEAVKIMLEANKHKAPKEFHYRLPSKTEWELMANAGYDAKTKKQHKKHLASINQTNETASKIHSVNMKFKTQGKDLDPSLELASNPMSPAPGRSYLPNKYGIYNINGNVAEMVQEPGIAMGGSFEHYYDDIIPTNKEIGYEVPQKWLGFRCVCVVTNE